MLIHGCAAIGLSVESISWTWRFKCLVKVIFVGQSPVIVWEEF